MRRSIPLVATALGVALTLAACSGSSNTPAAENTPSETATTAALTGTLTMWVDDTRIKEMQPVVDAFTQKTGVKVSLVQKASGDIGKDFVAQVPTGEGPDVIVSAHDGLGEWVNNGVVAPVQLGDKAKDFSASAIAGVTYDGKTYGTPISIENIALVRNNKLLKDTPAKTFDELVTQAKTAGTPFSVLIQQGDASDPYHLYPLQSSFGAPVFKQNTDGSYTKTLAPGGDAGTAFAAYLAKLGTEKVLDLSIDGAKAKQAFLDGQAPYMITGPWNTSAFVAAGMDISVLPVPSAGGQPAQPFVGVQGVFISAKSKNALLANEGLPAIETYDLQFATPTVTQFFLPRNAMLMVAGTDRNESIDLGDTIETVEGTIGYLAIGRAAGQPTPGRAAYIQHMENKPPRVEGEVWQTSGPVISEPEALYVIKSIT